MKIITSPPLVQGCYGDKLQRKDNATPAVCIPYLKRFVVMPKIAPGTVYWIELSRRQWPDGKGAAIWIRRRRERFQWGTNFRYQGSVFFGEIRQWLNRNIRIPTDTPIRFFFRLTYEERPCKTQVD